MTVWLFIDFYVLGAAVTMGVLAAAADSAGEPLPVAGIVVFALLWPVCWVASMVRTILRRAGV